MSDEKNNKDENPNVEDTKTTTTTAGDLDVVTTTVEDVVLVGSPNFDAEVKIGEHKSISLGDLVQAAFDSTTVDEEYWNEMSQERRDKVIQRTLDGLKS